MQELDLSPASTQRRRSERVSQSVPVVVRGIDLLSQPFEERTATLTFNLHGCRYSSKHYLPKNAWVTIELIRGTGRHNVRARVAWIQRPHSVREYFQIAVEFESPANIWGLDSPPADWFPNGHSTHAASKNLYEPRIHTIETSQAVIDTTMVAALMEKLAKALLTEYIC